MTWQLERRRSFLRYICVYIKGRLSDSYSSANLASGKDDNLVPRVFLLGTSLKKAIVNQRTVITLLLP